MKTRKFVDLERRLAMDFPDFAIKGTLMFLSPPIRLLRGLCFEGSSFDKNSFYVNFFVLPLCRPTDHLYFSFGGRVRCPGGGDRWNVESPNLRSELVNSLMNEAVPYLRGTKALSDFIANAKSAPQNIRTLEATGFALARLNEIEPGD